MKSIKKDGVANEDEAEELSDDSNETRKRKKVKIRYTPRSEFLPEWGFQRKSSMNVESDYYTVI